MIVWLQFRARISIQQRDSCNFAFPDCTREIFRAIVSYALNRLVPTVRDRVAVETFLAESTVSKPSAAETHVIEEEQNTTQHVTQQHPATELVSDAQTATDHITAEQINQLEALKQDETENVRQ